MQLLKQRQEKKPSFFFWGFHLLDKWLQIKNKGGSLAAYFEDNAIDRVAVYGLGAIGRRLVEELGQGKVKVLYGIDRDAANITIEGLTIMTLADHLPRVEAIVVTPLSFYEIEKELYQKMGKDIVVVFIEDVIEYCLSE